MRNQIFLFALSLFVLVHAHAQPSITSQAAADFVRINSSYANAKKLKMNVDYNLYPSYTSTAVFRTDKGVYMKQNGNSYSELFGIISLHNSRVSLTVDDSEKTMLVADPLKKGNDLPSEVDLDTLLKICSSIQCKTYSDGTKYYRLTFENVAVSQYNSIDIFFDTNTYLLTRLVLYFREETDLDENDSNISKDRPRLEIKYSSIDNSPVFDSTQFSETRFILIAGKKISCTSSYSSYHLINNKLN